VESDGHGIQGIEAQSGCQVSMPPGNSKVLEFYQIPRPAKF